MAANNFDPCFAFTVGVEGGYGADSQDLGNWTGGRIGVGELKGTKYGVSAAAYPNLDIKNLSLADARAIYRRDYWNKVQGDQLPLGVDLVVFDGAVNSGPGESDKWLQEAVGATPDGAIGPMTLAAVAQHPADEIIRKACANRLAALETYRGWDRYGKGWTNRVEALQAHALAMTA